MRRLIATAAGVLVGGSAFAMGSAVAQPIPAPPPGPAQPGSTTDELADMVLDVIEQGTPTIPTTTPLPVPAP